MECELITMTSPTLPEGNEQRAEPQYPQPQYPQPQYPQPQLPHPDGRVGGRPQFGVLSILTLVTSLFLGFVSVVLGVFALRQNWKNGTRGSVMAWIGIVIGAIVGVFWSVMIMIGYLLSTTNP